jgi:hypothetical protein
MMLMNKIKKSFYINKLFASTALILSCPYSALVYAAVVNSPPVISGIPVTSVNVGNTYNFVPTASDPNNDKLTFSIVNKPARATFNTSTGALKGVPTTAYTATITNAIAISVRDGKGGSVSLPAFSLTVPNRAPVISGTPTSSVNIGVAYSFIPTASDADKNTLKFSIVNKPVWATFNTSTGALTGVPSTTYTATITNSIIISVTDGKGGSASLPTFSLTVPNQVPVISGTPAISANIGFAYSFIPTATDADKNTLTFSITNKPIWAKFNASTGALTGIPVATNVGVTNVITISVSDGKGGNASLAAFNLTVAQPNRAPVISGTPTTSINVGATYNFIPTASDADNDVLTFSIANKPTWASFNTNTGALTGTPTATDIATTSAITISVTDGKGGSASLAAFNLTVAQPNRAPVISGTPTTSINVGATYSFIPTASDADNDTLTFSIVNKPAWASFNTSTGALTGTPTANDVATTNAITISVTDGKGGNASLAAFGIQVSSGETLMDKAIRTGDASIVTEQTILTDALQTLATIKTQRKQSYIDVYKLDANGLATANSITGIDWDPSHDSVWFDSGSLEQAFPLFVSNAAAKIPQTQRKNLAMAGTLNGYRFGALGANPFHDLKRTTQPGGTGNAKLQEVLESLLGWLTQRNDLKTAAFNIVVAHMPDSYWFKHDATTEKWFKDTYPNASINAQDVCESTKLAACLTNANLLLIGQDNGTEDTHGIPFDLAATLQAVKNAQARGIPVLYVQYDGGTNDLGNALMDLLKLRTTDNYWNQEKLVAYDPLTLLSNDPLAPIETAVTNLANNTLPSTLVTACKGIISTLDGCTDASFKTNLRNGLDITRAALQVLDTQGFDLFGNSGNRLLKSLVLLGDKYRVGDAQTAAITYPVDLNNATAIGKAAFADWSVYYSRNSNKVQKNLGTFICEKSLVTSGNCPMYALPATLATDVTETMLSTEEWTSTGLYLLPGKSITIQRTDINATANVGVFFNFQRVTTSRSLESYDRPQYMQSTTVKIAPGETKVLSSPYGGPIYLRLYGDAANNSKQISLNFNGVAQHASVLNIGDPVQVQQFVNDVKTNPLPHVDIRGDGFEAHMRKDKFLNSASVPISLEQKRNDTTLTINYGGDVQKLFNDYKTNFVETVYNLAGFKLPGKSLVNTLSQDVQSACANFGWDCTNDSLHVRRNRQHANYDQYAACGSGCSGNPFDASWNISPIGWGDSHELGHNLQTKALNVHYVLAADRNDWSKYASRAGENSNNIFPYNTVWHYYRVVNNDNLNITDGHMNQLDVFSMVQSDLQNLTGSVAGITKKVILNSQCAVHSSYAIASSNNRYPAIWQNAGYAADNGVRMSFLLQLPVLLDNKPLRDGTVLNNGFDIFTLLYSQSRLFYQAAKSETAWNAARSSLGFGAFPYVGNTTYGGGNVSAMPGNDYLLVALAYITGKDWRTYFDLRGVYSSDLASQQVDAHIAANLVTSAVSNEFVVLDTD